MGTSNSPHVMTLVNSIIGVSILAMPFCYKQCGILLASLILILINLLTRLSCHYLLKSAIMTRRKNFEFLAFHAFGGSGKTTIELCIILLMIGTCIAFFVVMGDLGPAIISSLLNMEFSTALRPAVLIGLAIFVVLPLGMLRNVDSLSFICTLSFLFYILLVLKVFFESADNLLSASWINEIDYWKPTGILQCLPIFSMALSCQTQLFEIFDSVTNATLDRMNLIVKYAVDLCTALYIAVGVFGYIAYYKTPMTGNLLMSFSPSLFSEIIKLFFVLSVAVTFPLVIFPCRASLYSLLFRKAHVPHYELVTGGGNHIPEAQFKCITFFIITISLVVGLLAPNIEIVLGLVGSTIGVIICLLFPPLLFIWLSTKATTEKVLAQMMCMIGIFIMVMGTYANLYLSETTGIDQNWKPVETLQALESKVDIAAPLNNLDLNVVKPEINEIKNVPKLMEPNKPEEKIKAIDKSSPIKEIPKEDKRVEPPIPIDPDVQKSPNQQNKIIQKSKPKLDPSPKSMETKIESPAKNKPQDKKNSIPILNKDEGQIKDDNLIQNAPQSVEQKSPPEKAIQPESELEKQKVMSEFIKSKPPLAILMNSNGSIKRENSKDKVIQRDIQGNGKNIAEREKRDLYATNETFKETRIIDTSQIEDKHDDGFVQNIANSVKTNQTCDKNISKENKIPLEEKSNEITKNVQIEKVLENPKDTKENLIIAPSKLSDPQLILQRKLPQNDDVKLDPDNELKPMLRELKAAEAKESDDRKK